MRRAAAAVVGLVAIAAGCGDGPARLTRPQYERAVTDVRVRLGPPAERLFFAIVVPRPRAGCAADARAFHAALERIVDRLAALRAPREVEALQRRFLDAARRSVETVGRAAEDAARGALACGDPMNRRIYGLASTREAEQVIAELERRGYRVGFGE